MRIEVSGEASRHLLGLYHQLGIYLSLLDTQIQGSHNEANRWPASHEKSCSIFTHLRVQGENG